MADNLVLGRGKIFFAPYARNAVTGGTKGYFGNTPTLTLTQTNTKLDHYSSEGGLKVKDKSIVLQSDMVLAFDTDNISPGNLALWFGGENIGTAPSDAPAGLGTMTMIGKGASIFGAMFFESDNPVGANQNYWFPYCSLQPTGAYALKGDAWQVMSFTAECLKRDAATERVYMYSPTAGTSTAATDTTPEFTIDTAEISSDTVAASATITVVTPQVHAIPFTSDYTLTGGTLAFASLHDGTDNVGAVVVVMGATGHAAFTAPSAGTYTARIYGSADLSGSIIGSSDPIIVS